jgi:serine O-acetyltransferase
MFEKLRSDIECILDRDPAARSPWEVLTCYPGLHAIYIHKLARWFWLHGMRWLGRFVSHFGRWLTGIEIHPGARIGSCVFIDHGMGVVIGETAEVGDGCTIYQGVTLGGTSLYPGTKRHPTLGAGVIVGAGAKVLGGFTVGDGARIGANSVVVKEVAAGATVVGIPGRVVEEQTRDKAERFAAYAVVQEQDDPYAKAIQQLVEHSQELERAVAALTDKLARLEKAEPEQLRVVK